MIEWMLGDRIAWVGGRQTLHLVLDVDWLIIDDWWLMNDDWLIECKWLNCVSLVGGRPSFDWVTVIEIDC